MKIPMNTAMASLSYLAAAAVVVVTRRSSTVSSFIVRTSSLSTTTRTTTTAFAATTTRSSRNLISSSTEAAFVLSSSLSSSTARSRLFSSTTSTTETVTSKEGTENLIPVTLLSGFLGSGKTSTLQHLLENTEGLRIGVIVNDMASVNIDAKLISKTAGSVSSSDSDDSSSNNNGIVEMQNGCACCSLADELLTTIEDLVDSRASGSGSGDDSSNGFDAIVVELSGVADPIAIKQNWKNAQITDQSVTKKADMKRIVTLIDSSTFGTDWMTWDDVGERGWVDPILEDGCTSQRKVPELLAEQIEAADVLLLNKIDLAGPKQVQIAKELAKQINENAIIEEVEFGKVSSPKQIIRDDAEKEKKEEVAEEETKCNDPGCDDHSHSHSHSHAEKVEDSSCKDTDCGDPDCDEHGTTAAVAAAAVDSSCTDSDCTDKSHDHSHSSHATTVDSSCSDPKCGDPDCDEHGTAAAAAAADSSCADTDCTDPSHDHSHASHSHSTSTDNLGIVNFVYKADRPFQTQNLMSLLNTWPVPIKENLEDLLQYEEEEEDSSSSQSSPGNDTRESPFSGVLRSKGFCWLAPTKWSPDKVGNNKSRGDQWRHDTAMYWSHAGRHFGISTAGKWWATLPQKDIKAFFKDDPTEYNRIMEEDFQKDSAYGDRRQEIVFIGININEEEITKSLDNCLVGKEVGMERYSEQLDNYMNTIKDVSE